MIQMIFTILIIVAAVFFWVKKLYFVVFPKRSEGKMVGCAGGCSACSMHQKDSVKIVFKPFNVPEN